MFSIKIFCQVSFGLKSFGLKSFGQTSWLKSIAHIPSPSLDPTPSIVGNITGSDILTNWHDHYVLAKWYLVNILLTKWRDSITVYLAQILVFCRHAFVRVQHDDECHLTADDVLQRRGRQDHQVRCRWQRPFAMLRPVSGVYTGDCTAHNLAVAGNCNLKR